MTYKVRICLLGEYIFCAPDRLVNRPVERFANSQIVNVQKIPRSSNRVFLERRNLSSYAMGQKNNTIVH